MVEPLLEVEHLSTAFGTPSGRVFAVNDVSFSVQRGETLGLVGESGCGKSLTALSMMRLLPPHAQHVGGVVRVGGRDVFALHEPELRALRGRRMAMVFQDPMSGLNPVLSVGEQVAEGPRYHLGLGKQAAFELAAELLTQVGLQNAGDWLKAYPHTLSGGMRQRVLLAVALAADPELLLADEPTTALDVTLQAQIVERLQALQAARQMALVLISHDLARVAQLCARVLVMYAGRVVEEGSSVEIFTSPAHPYTAGLIRATASLASPSAGPLYTIPGSVPALSQLPSGCAFRDRCERVQEVCARVVPALEQRHSKHFAACHNPVPH